MPRQKPKKPAPKRKPATPRAKAKAFPGGQRFSPPPPVLNQAWLSGATPGWWISDHLEELKHFVSWIYVGVHKVAQQVAQATVNIYDRSEQAQQDVYFDKAMRFGRSRRLAELGHYLRLCRRKSHTPDTAAERETPIPDHRAARLLARPNPLTSGTVFRYQFECQLRLTGGCYVWEVPNQFGEPEHLWVIPKGWVRPMAPTPASPLGWYQVTPVFNTFTQGVASPSTSTWMIPYEQMIDVKWPNPLYPGEGTSPLSACSQIIDIMEQTDTATWASFVNSVKPSLVFNLDPRNGQVVTQEMIDQLMTQIETFKAGSNNAGKVLAMLGLTVQQMMSGPGELDYVNGRVQNRENVLAIQGVSPVVAGLAGAGSYSEAAVGAKCTVEFSVQPDLVLFGDTFTHHWQKHWGDDFRIELTAKSMDDPTLRLQKMDKVAQAFQLGVVSANEYRAAIDEPPLEDPIADIPQVLLQSMVPGVGSPDPGLAGLGDAEDPYAAFATEGDEMPTDTDTGIANPIQAEAPGRMAKAFRLNGFSANGTH